MSIPNSHLKTEVVSVDCVLDRLYVKYRNKMRYIDDNDGLVKQLTDQLNSVFTSYNYDAAFVKRRLERIHGYQTKLEALKNLPIVEQRSQQWYEMRQTRITASDAFVR